MEQVEVEQVEQALQMWQVLAVAVARPPSPLLRSRRVPPLQQFDAKMLR